MVDSLPKIGYSFYDEKKFSGQQPHHSIMAKEILLSEEFKSSKGKVYELVILLIVAYFYQKLKKLLMKKD